MERSNDIASISPFDFCSVRDSLLAQTPDDINGPFFQYEEYGYERWAGGDLRWRMCVYGAPQSGKTTLAAAVVQELQERFQSESRLTIVSIFADPEDEMGGDGSEYVLFSSPDPVETLLRVILRQMLTDARRLDIATPELPSGLPLQGLWTYLETLCKSFAKKFLIVDAFDTCPVDLRLMIESQLASLVGLGFSLMVTSAEPVFGTPGKDCDGPGCEAEGLQCYWHCQLCEDEQREYDLCPSCLDDGLVCPRAGHERAGKYQEVGYEMTCDDDSLGDFIEKRLEADKAGYDLHVCERLKFEKHALKDRIVKHSDGAFGIAKAFVDSLRDFQMSGLEEILHLQTRVSLPAAEYFDHLIRKVARQPQPGKDVAMMTLNIIAQASSVGRHLVFEELEDALSDARPDTLESKPLTKQLLLHYCKGIVSYYDNTMQLAPFHGSLDVYLRENCGDEFSRTKVDLLELCLERLPSLRGLKGRLSDDGMKYELDPRPKPLTIFASRHWANLLRGSAAYEDYTYDDGQHPGPSTTIGKALQLLRDEDLLAASLCVARDHSPFDLGPGARAMHICAWFGLDKFIQPLMRNSTVDLVNQPDPVNLRTPLMIAVAVAENDDTSLHQDFIDQILQYNAHDSAEDRWGGSALVKAILEDDQDIVDRLLVDWRDQKTTDKAPHTTPLIAAIVSPNYDSRECYRVELCEKILTRPDFDVNRTTRDGHTALTRAIECENRQVLEIILRQPGLAFDELDERHRTPLHNAAADSSKDVIQAILRSKYCTTERMDLRDIDGKAAISLLFDNAKFQDDQVTLLELLRSFKQHGAILSSTDKLGQGIVHAATRHPHVIVVRWMLEECGLSIDQKDEHGWTPLHTTCAHGHAEVAALLVEKGAGTSARDTNGRTPYDLVVGYFQGNKPNLLSLMDPHESETSIKHSSLVKPLIWSLQGSEMDSLGSLKDATVSDLLTLDWRDGNNLLHRAAIHGNIGLCKHILDTAPGSVDVLDRNGQTALAIAVDNTRNASSYFQVMEYLLQRNADSSVRFAGQTILDRARQHNGPKAALLLIEYSAAPFRPGPDSRVLMATAIREGKTTIVKRLLASGCSPWEHSYDKLPKRESSSDEIRKLLADGKRSVLRDLYPHLDSA